MRPKKFLFLVNLLTTKIVQTFTFFQGLIHFRTEMLNLLFRTLPRVACQTRAASKKPPRNANLMKKYNQENKLMFGALLESSLERKKKRNLELPISDDKIDDINSPVNFDQLMAAFEEELPQPKQKAKKKSTKISKKSAKVCAVCSRQFVSLVLYKFSGR
jgi:hypothetical protein